jgi:DNA primase
MPAIAYAAARRQLCLAEVLALIDYQPRARHGLCLRGPCPVHGSRSARNRSFAVHLGNNLYPCFRCAAGGNALDLWAALQRLPLHAAVLDLCERLGRPVPWLSVPSVPTRR